MLVNCEGDRLHRKKGEERGKTKPSKELIKRGG